MTRQLQVASTLADAALAPERWPRDGEDLAELLRASLERLAQILQEADEDTKVALAIEDARVRCRDVGQELVTVDYALLVGEPLHRTVPHGRTCLWVSYRNRPPSPEVVREWVDRWRAAMIVYASAGAQEPPALSVPGTTDLVIHALSNKERAELPVALLFDAFGYKYLNEIRSLPGANRRIQEVLGEQGYDREQLLKLSLAYSSLARLHQGA